MQQFHSLLQHRLRKKNMHGQALGTHVLHVLRGYAAYPDELKVRIRHQVVFVSLGPKEDAAQRYFRKQEILADVLEHVQKHTPSCTFHEMRISAV